MTDFTINEMQAMQRTLQDRYRHKWEPIGPATGQNKLLWMIGEVGEVIDIVKKHGGETACTDPALRSALVEELADIMMFCSATASLPMSCGKLTPRSSKRIWAAGNAALKRTRPMKT